MEEPLDPGDIRNTRPADARPFVVAFIGFVIIAVLAFFFLREDEGIEVLRPDTVRAAGPDSVDAFVDAAPECTEVIRAQVDVSDPDAVFVELIVRTAGECLDVLAPINATVELPEPLADRRVVPGVGRIEVPCASAPLTEPDSADGSGWLCTQDQ